MVAETMGHRISRLVTGGRYLLLAIFLFVFIDLYPWRSACISLAIRCIAGAPDGVVPAVDLDAHHELPP